MADFELPITGFASRLVRQPLWPRVVISWAPTAYGISKRPAPGSSWTVWSGQVSANPLLLTGERQRVRAVHAAYDAVEGHEQIVMIFSCSDRKPSHHLGIKIPRVGLPCLALYPG